MKATPCELKELSATASRRVTVWQQGCRYRVTSLPWRVSGMTRVGKRRESGFTGCSLIRNEEVTVRGTVLDVLYLKA